MEISETETGIVAQIGEDGKDNTSACWGTEDAPQRSVESFLRCGVGNCRGYMWCV